MVKIKNRANSPYNLRDGDMQKVRIGARATFEVVDNADDADNETKFFLTENQVKELLRIAIFERLKDDAEVTPVAKHIETLLGSSKLPAMIDLNDETQVQLGDVVARSHKDSGLSIEEWNKLEDDDREERLEATIQNMRVELETFGDNDQSTVDDQSTDDESDENDEPDEDDADNEPQLSRAELRAKYKKLAGKNAPKSWKADRLTQEIAGLEE